MLLQAMDEPFLRVSLNLGIFHKYGLFLLKQEIFTLCVADTKSLLL